MTQSFESQLVDLSERSATLAARMDDSEFAEPLNALLHAAEEVEAAWSGSCLGYHALVYYADFRRPPPGAHFSQEWGLMGSMTLGTTGDWHEYAHDDVIAHISQSAGNSNVDRFRTELASSERIFRELHDDALSLLRAELRRVDDDHLKEILDRVVDLAPLSYATCLQGQLPSGQLMTRDTTAAGQGRQPAPHQEIIAQVLAMRSPFVTAAELAALCRSAARHLQRIGGDETPINPQLRSSGRIAIGHGRSPLWRELKDFIADRLHLQWDEFNRVAVAGVTTTDRLQQMTEGCVAALLVTTAEDELPDGEMTARQNVIHEIGLFQGRLGFSRAIVLLEDGCSEFSNIHGLGQIRFPKGNISACFEDVRRVLEREGLL